MIARLGEAARFSFPVHPHMFRHPCGYKLAKNSWRFSHFLFGIEVIRLANILERQ
jgi:hypothetical protein